MSPIHMRICGYVITIVTHISNMLFMLSRFHGDVMNNDSVRHFSEMQYFFFTCWTFVMQTVYAAMALCSDILVLKNSKCEDYQPPKLWEALRELLFTVMVWPSTILTSTVFWTLFVYDRGLLYPVDIDLAIPLICNHIMHTGIVVATLWEAVFRPRVNPGVHWWRYLMVLMVEVLYITVLVGVYLIKGVWVYPIFGLLIGSVYFYLFFVAIATYLYFLYHAQWTFNDYVWGANQDPRMNRLVCYVEKTLNTVKWGLGLKKAA